MAAILLLDSPVTVLHRQAMLLHRQVMVHHRQVTLLHHLVMRPRHQVMLLHIHRLQGILPVHTRRLHNKLKPTTQLKADNSSCRRRSLRLNLNTSRILA
ncbi:Hypothetical protein PHPALM_9763 [Phytophthora palmivora]|uniref:Uncharacterized protein n=1 Tax=Phytophthora palmivora TaxID=4796 RepID=A0A2P4Y6E7_9STRA|nr:Hypothetical protein PHPALM_9763 [Phytophthora palmivora]